MASDEVGRKDSKDAEIKEWMREHGERLLAVAERYATPVVGAQDIVQEALMTAWKKWERRPPPDIQLVDSRTTIQVVCRAGTIVGHVPLDRGLFANTTAIMSQQQQE